jgi:hypothetical protein
MSVGPPGVPYATMGSQDGVMDPACAIRRLFMKGLPGLAAALAAGPAQARWFGRGRGRQPDRFDQALTYAGGVHPATLREHVSVCPDGARLTMRVAAPIDPPRTIPVVLLAGSSRAASGAYDPMMVALAGRGYLVIAPDFTARPRESLADSRWRRMAEMRYACDQIFAVRAALGPTAERMEPNVIAAWGHGDGCCIAMRLVGFNHAYAPDSTFADGRFRASVALEPVEGFPIGNIGELGQAAPMSSGSGLIIGAPGAMPLPQRGTGLYGLTIAGQSRRDAPLVFKEGRDAVAMAATLLFFDWQLRGDGEAGEALHALNQRAVAGLEAPLSLVRS